jgi:diguanylate cyclase (GGDEF)-like protein/PAS domain S-box-containing protein
MADPSQTGNGTGITAAEEEARLAELRDLAVLDTPAEPEFDDLVETASLIAGTPIALMTLIDEDRQWFKARKGLEATETPRDVAFCSRAIESPDEPLIVEDARIDPRFADNPLVTGDPHVAFYAGVPIVTSEGHALGTICVVDDKPGELTQDQVDALAGLSRQAAALLELRRRTRNLNAVLDQERSGRADAQDRDPLTGLPTREALEARIAEQDLELPTSLLVIEFIHFSEVNAALGREGGDRILQAAARQLASRLPPSSMLARIESTTFAALVPDTDPARAAALARDFTRELAAPIRTTDFDPIAINSVVGTATTSPLSETGRGDLIEDAELAAAHAKRQGPGSTVAAGTQTITDRARTARLRTSLTRALSEGRITAVYMPVVELASGETVGAESLVRFPGPEFKNASIDELIALAEANGLVGVIDAFMIEKALEEFAAGRVDAPSVGVNLSPVAIGPDLPDRIRDALDRHGVNPDCLVLEITERAALSDNPDLSQALNGLAAMGVRIAIDDFGAGATSIGDLRKLPFDLLKLDRSLIADIDGADSRRAFMIVQALTGMAKSLGIDVVAEGIENERLRDRLVDAGVGFGQGYLFGRPAPAGQEPIMRDPSELGAPRPVGVHMERLAGAFFEQSPDMACVGTDEQLLRVNDNWERTVGWTREQMLARPLVDFIHPDDVGVATEKLETLAEGHPTTFEVRFATPDGGWKILDWNARRDPDTGLNLATARDVTREREAELERDRLRLVMEVLSDLQERYIEEGISRDWWNEALRGIIELSDSEYGFIGRVEHDEEDRPYLISYAITNIAWNDWSRGVYQEFKDGGLEFRNLETLFGVTLATGEMVIANDAPHDPRKGGLPEGHPALDRYVGIPLTNENGIVGMVGLANRPGGYDKALIADLAPIFASLSQIISRDIERRRARQVEFDATSTSAAVEAILESQDMPHVIEIVEHAVGAIEPRAGVDLFVIGESRERLTRFDGAETESEGVLHREACLALTRGELHVTRPGDPPDQRCAHADPDAVTICVPVDNPEEEFGVVITDAHPGSEEEGDLPAEAVGRLIQTLGIVTPAIAEVARREDLAHRALTDSLTGLANRLSFVQSVNRSLDSSATDGSCFGVMMLDLDDFKAVNDTLGHQAGDMLLEEAGHRIKDVLRDEDTVARLGGDEFGVLVSGCGASSDLLERTCERVREAIAGMPVGAGLRVTASVGAVEVTGPDTSWDEIYRIADRELYASKKGGRDYVHVAADRLGAP